MTLQGKIAAVTGGGGGIGRSACELFAQNGALVYILEINKAAAEEASAQIAAAGGTAIAIPTDVSSEESVRAAFAQIQRQSGGIDILYNNASVFWGTKDCALAGMDMAVFERILRINLFGTAYCTKYAIPLLKARGGGSIIMTSSSCGLIGVPNCDAYSASKGGIISMTRALAVEYGPDGIRTNCIAPAAIHTPMIYESDLNKPEFDENWFLTQKTPLRRWGTAQDIANVALFLASDASSYINGAVIVADAGITIT